MFYSKIVSTRDSLRGYCISMPMFNVLNDDHHASSELTLSLLVVVWGIVNLVMMV